MRKEEGRRKGRRKEGRSKLALCPLTLVLLNRSLPSSRSSDFPSEDLHEFNLRKLKSLFFQTALIQRYCFSTISLPPQPLETPSFLHALALFWHLTWYQRSLEAKRAPFRSRFLEQVSFVVSHIAFDDLPARSCSFPSHLFCSKISKSEILLTSLHGSVQIRRPTSILPSKVDVTQHDFLSAQTPSSFLVNSYERLLG